MTFDEKKKIKKFWKYLWFKYNNFKKMFCNYNLYEIKLKNLIKCAHQIILEYL